MSPHIIVAPIVLPLFMVAVLILLGNKRLGLVRGLSLATAALNLAAGIALVTMAHSDAGFVYEVGDWDVPFGIVLTLDRLSALMVALTGFVGFVSLLYACHGGDREGPYFHPLFLMLLTGVQGAFLTGDIFNLFVFFEILLLGSYVLLLYGARASRVKAGIHYVAINLVGSGLFLIGVGTLYAFTGTLNMADMAAKMATLDPGDAAIVKTGALILLVVFGIKAAILPLYFWLPKTYGSASAPVAAIFAIMTKVGVYAIIRVHGFILGPEAGPAALAAEPWLVPIGLLTLGFAMLGAVQAKDLRGMAGHLVVASVGTMVTAVGLFSKDGLSAALYYMVHSTLVMAAFYLVIDLVRRERGDTDDALTEAPQVRHPAAIGILFFIVAVAAVGLPPLSGFLGKVFVLKAASASDATGAIWGVILGGSLLGMIAVSRAGSAVFWKATPRPDDAPAITLPPGKVIVIGVLILAIVAWTAFAGPIAEYTDATAAGFFGSPQTAALVPHAGGLQ